MIFYMSIPSKETQNAQAINQVEPLKNVNILCSFQYRKGMCDFLPKHCKNFMADSGAFTAMNAGLEIDTKYIDNYIKWIIDNEIQHYIEMDLDEIVGVDETKAIRNYIENAVGIKSIPCFHLERGKQGWIEMCEQYDYIAISLSRMTKISKWLQKNKFLPLNWFMNQAKITRTKVHGLGCNDFGLMRKYHFYSCDCSTHTQGSRYGRVFDFRNGKLVDINKQKKYKVNGDAADRQNIKAVIEVMKYAERMF